MVKGDPHLDSRQVMERFNISKTTLYRWMNDPDLDFPQPAMRINRRHYFSEAAIDAWEIRIGRVQGPEPEKVEGCNVVSGIIQSYEDLVSSMVKRRQQLGMPCIELDARSGMQEGYSNKLENWGKDYGKGIGPNILPLWLGGLRVGIVLVDLPRRLRPKRKVDAAAAA